MADNKSLRGIEAATRELAKVTASISALSEFNHRNFLFLQDRSQISSVTSAITNIVNQNMLLYRQYEIPMLSAPITRKLLSHQWDVIANIARSVPTPEITKLHTSLMRNDFSGVRTFVDSIGSTGIKAPNVALLKTSKIFTELSQSFPRGLSTVLRGLSVNAAKKLADNEDICLDIPSKTFYVAHDPEEKVSIPETNIICSSLDLLSELTEADLISFLNYLSRYPEFGSMHETGRAINEIIAQWDVKIGFEEDYYYHARALGENDCPFTQLEMGQAPHGITSHGRFNHVGQSHYYFSDKSKGACAEVRKHTKLPRVEIAKLKPVRDIKMIDLSQDPAPNLFLSYCRFAPSKDNATTHREYLIPGYVATCCELNGIEGIKYYGSKEYTNFVSWKDHYLDCIDLEICSLSKLSDLSD
ncbi:MAG: RES family NAD+ phosphorylase [Clostridia bacterium]|nr:RES family NAD+ phosphorylase [Clostridia bacterium]